MTDEMELENEEFEVTLDSWKPTTEKPSIIQSQWRKEQIGKNSNQDPCADDLRKIQMHLKRYVPDNEIIKTFGITAETLVAIKRNKYSPVDGISLDNQSKIYKEFKKVEDKTDELFKGLNYIADILFIDDEGKKLFKEAMKKKKEEKKKNKGAGLN